MLDELLVDEETAELVPESLVVHAHDNPLLVWLLREEHTCVVCDWTGWQIGRARNGDSELQRLASKLFQESRRA